MAEGVATCIWCQKSFKPGMDAYHGHAHLLAKCWVHFKNVQKHFCFFLITEFKSGSVLNRITERKNWNPGIQYEAPSRVSPNTKSSIAHTCPAMQDTNGPMHALFPTWELNQLSYCGFEISSSMLKNIFMLKIFQKSPPKSWKISSINWRGLKNLRTKSWFFILKISHISNNRKNKKENKGKMK